MKKSIFSKVFTCLVMLFVLSALTFTIACGGGNAGDNGGNNGDNPQNPPASEYYLNLDKTSVSLVVDDSVKLNADYKEQVGQILTFESADATIATVDFVGNVKGISQGTTTVTAKYGDLTKACTVTVDNQGLVPIIVFNQALEATQTVTVGDSLDFTSYVEFNAKKFTDAQTTYTLSDTTMGSVENGVFTPAKTGTVTLTVTATWRGQQTAEKTFTITATNTVQFLVNGGATSSVELFALAQIKEQTFVTEKPFAVQTLFNGEDKTSETNITVLNDTVAYYDASDDTIQARGIGVTKVKIEITVGEDTYSAEIPVTVARSVYSQDTTVYAVDFEKDITNFVSYITDDLTEAFDADNADIAVSGKKITGVASLVSAKAEVMPITVYTAKAGYALNIVPYTKVIANASELDALKVTSATDLKIGHYALSADINYNNAEFAHDYTTFNGDNGFHGVFDGRGYTISNIKLKKGGLFGTLRSAADDVVYDSAYAVKNLAIKGVTLVGGDANVICRTLNMNQTTVRYRFENVYIQVTALPGTSGFGIICTENMRQYTEFNNVIIDTGDLTTTASQYGVLAQYGANNDTANRINSKSTNGENNGKPRIQNTYVLSNMVLSYWWRNGTHTSDYCDDAGNKSVLSGTEEVFRANQYSTWSAEVGNTTSNSIDIVKLYARSTMYKNMVRYTTSDISSLAVGTNDYSSFEASGLWNVSGKLPVWVGAN